MNTRPITRLAQCFLLVALVAGSTLPATAAPAPAPDQGFDISSVLPGVRLLGGLFARNRTYQSAEDYIAERNAYYDNLHATLLKQYDAYKRGVIEGAPEAQKINRLRQSQLAAFIKQAALIEAERKAALDFAEAIKKGARRDFTKAVKEEIKSRLIATGMVQQVFGAITSGFGQAQQFVDVAISKVDSGGPVDQVVRKLRTVTTRLDQASALFGGPVMGDLRRTLANLSDKIERQAKLTKEELSLVKKEMKTVADKIKALKASRQAPVASQEVLSDLGLQLVGWGSGTPATEAILNLVTRRTGLSSQTVRQRGMAYLQAGYVARCRARAAEYVKAWQTLEAETGPEVKTQPPGTACEEIPTEDLESDAPITPLDDQNTSDSGTAPVDRDFSEKACACGDFQVSEALPWGNASLTCTYEWTGASGVQNRLSFEASRVYHLDEQMRAFEQESGDLTEKASSVGSDQKVTEFDKSGSDYGMVITGPGGTTTTTNQPIPMCGNGNGSYAYGEDYLITTSLFACDLGSAEQDYIDALQTLAVCAMDAIDSKYR